MYLFFIYFVSARSALTFSETYFQNIVVWNRKILKVFLAIFQLYAWKG